MFACQIWTHLAVVVLRMDGEERMCLRWFSAVYKRRSAGTNRAIHNPLASSQKPLMSEDVDAQAHEHAHSSRSSSCRKHLQRSDAHLSMSLYAVSAFLQRIYIRRKRYAFTRPPDAEHWTHKNTHMAEISVSACQFLLCCPGATPGENTGSPYWAVLNEPTLKPMTY